MIAAKSLETTDVETIERGVQRRLGNRVRELHVKISGPGIEITGQAKNYHAKQLAQHAVMELTDFPIIANRIVVA